VRFIAKSIILGFRKKSSPFEDIFAEFSFPKASDGGKSAGKRPSARPKGAERRPPSDKKVKKKMKSAEG
jgi:hypothetical protein